MYERMAQSLGPMYCKVNVALLQCIMYIAMDDPVHNASIASIAMEIMLQYIANLLTIQLLLGCINSDYIIYVSVLLVARLFYYKL